MDIELSDCYNRGKECLIKDNDDYEAYLYVIKPAGCNQSFAIHWNHDLIFDILFISFFLHTLFPSLPDYLFYCFVEDFEKVFSFGVIFLLV